VFVPVVLTRFPLMLISTKDNTLSSLAVPVILNGISEPPIAWLFVGDVMLDVGSASRFMSNDRVAVELTSPALSDEFPSTVHVFVPWTVQYAVMFISTFVEHALAVQPRDWLALSSIL